jgi:hypothetical protein
MNLQQCEMNCVDSFATIRFHLQQMTIETEDISKYGKKAFGEYLYCTAIYLTFHSYLFHPNLCSFLWRLITCQRTAFCFCFPLPLNMELCCAAVLWHLRWISRFYCIMRHFKAASMKFTFSIVAILKSDIRTLVKHGNSRVVRLHLFLM